MILEERDEKGKFKFKLSTRLVGENYGKLEVIKNSGKKT